MIASKIVSDTVQTDGRRMIREKHTDDFGVVQFIDYIAERDFDAEQALQDRHAYIDAQNVQADLDKCVETLELPTRASPLEFILKIKELYLAAEGFEVARLATFLISRGESELTELRLNFEKIQAEAALFQTVVELRGA